MVERPKILILGRYNELLEPLIEWLSDRFDFIQPNTIGAGLQYLEQESLAGLFLLGPDASAVSLLSVAGGILEQIPGGLALLNSDFNIVWSNARLSELAGSSTPLAGAGFFEAFGEPEILGPDFSPFQTALGSGESARSTLCVGEKTYLEVEATPVFENDHEEAACLIVSVRNISKGVLQRKKLNAIYQAGLELGHLSAQDVLEYSLDERIDLLKSKIVHFANNVLEFETIEIRLLDQQTKQLDPLLIVGMDDDAGKRALYALPTDNGVTGFVAATGKSYLCEDTQTDPLYLAGAPGARSSLTVPIVLQDEVLGTFNVESHVPRAFTEHDLQFLELFSREVAQALNTLELLVAEKMTTANESIERILGEVANPVDEVLNETTWVLERYIGHEPEVCDRLNRVLRHTREIKQLIQHVGQDITPAAARASLPARPDRPSLRDKRILVVDADESVRRAAHELLGRFGCEVETAHHGEEAFLMVRSFHYDAVIADIRLPDMDGFECFCGLREIHEHMQVILMTGFGYDPTHSIVKARQMGLKSVLYKPFRIDQLITEVEKAVCSPAELADRTSPESDQRLLDDRDG